MSDCLLCQAARPSEAGALRDAGFVVAFVDSDLIALVAADRPGVLVAPRRHDTALFADPQLSAPVLAALRRMIEEVKLSYGVASARIEVVTGPPAKEGHLCYHVVPVGGEGTKGRFELATRARRAADALRRRAVAQLRHVPRLAPLP